MVQLDLNLKNTCTTQAAKTHCVLACAPEVDDILITCKE